MIIKKLIKYDTNYKGLEVEGKVRSFNHIYTFYSLNISCREENVQIVKIDEKFRRKIKCHG